MAGQDPQKLVIIATHAEENPDKATLPFVMGNTALAMDMEATVILQSTGVYLAYRGYAEHVHAAGFPSLTELLATYLAAGGKLMICSPCMQARKITPEELIEPAVIIAGATLLSEIAAATNVVTY